MEEFEEEKSKSQKKRDAEALQKLGEQLTLLNADQLNTVPVPDEIKEAILSLKSIKGNAAKKRHVQYIGRLMRGIEEIEPVQLAYEKIIKGFAADKAHFHLVEKWRDRFLSQDKNALTDFLTQYTCDDRQALRQLVQKALKEQTNGQNHGAAKALFQLIKRIVE